ncbi:hypothetical protein B0H14DRAFT_3427337 [Mycena olivaceomarginata]|nr:hypothetical protein B0H14DRAFT_3427337 [Mycena olivaceomarginata]
MRSLACPRLYKAMPEPDAGPRRAYPASSSNPLVDVDVVCWPECVDKRYDPPGYPTPPIKIKNSHIKTYALRPEECKLTFQVQVPGQGAHLLLSRSPDYLDGQLWMLLQCSKKGDVYTLSEQSSINDNNPGYQEFKKFIQKFANVLPNSGGRPWILVG